MDEFEPFLSRLRQVAPKYEWANITGHLRGYRGEEIVCPLEAVAREFNPKASYVDATENPQLLVGLVDRGAALCVIKAADPVMDDLDRLCHDIFRAKLEEAVGLCSTTPPERSQ